MFYISTDFIRNSKIADTTNKENIEVNLCVLCRHVALENYIFSLYHEEKTSIVDIPFLK